MRTLLSIRKSKDGKSIIIGGKKYPLTINNLEAWKNYIETGDKEQLRFKLSTAVLDYGDN